MADVFISYKREDKPAAELVAAILEALQISCWWDASLVAGEQFNEAIQRELTEARCVVVLWSKASHASRWVQAEAIQGFDRDILVAARLDDVQLRYPFGIVQTADLRGWRETPAVLASLINGVSLKLKKDVPIPASLASLIEALKLKKDVPTPASPKPKVRMTTEERVARLRESKIRARKSADYPRLKAKADMMEMMTENGNYDQLNVARVQLLMSRRQGKLRIHKIGDPDGQRLVECAAVDWVGICNDVRSGSVFRVVDDETGEELEIGAKR